MSAEETTPSRPARVWYLVMSKPRGEEEALRNLQDQGYEAYLPRVSRKKRIRGRYQMVIESMFPRYLFIHLAAGIDDWGPIRSTPGVTTMVRFGERYAALPSNLIEGLRRRENKYGLIPLAPPAFEKGDAVRIIDGPFKDLEAIIHAKSGQERVILLLKIAGKEAKVQTSIHSLTPAKGQRTPTTTGGGPADDPGE